MIEMLDRDPNIVHSSNKVIFENINGNAMDNGRAHISKVETVSIRLRMG